MGVHVANPLFAGLGFGLARKGGVAATASSFAKATADRLPPQSKVVTGDHRCH